MRLLLFTALSLFSNVYSVHLYKRIVNGEPLTEETRLPFLASIQKPNGEHFCTGSHINSGNTSTFIVLTAAHCLADKDLSQVIGRYRVSMNRIDISKHALDEGGVDFVIAAINIISNFTLNKDGSASNDIAQLLLKPTNETLVNIPLLKPIDLDQFGLANKLNETGTGDVFGKDGKIHRSWLKFFNVQVQSSVFDDVKIAGWGTLRPGDKKASNIAQKAKMFITRHEKCKELMNPKALQEAYVCAQGQRGYSDACQGDSGGPLFVAGPKPVLVAITSYGAGCGEKYQKALVVDVALPAIYSSVHYYINWIQDNQQNLPQLRKRNFDIGKFLKGDGVTNIAKSFGLDVKKGAHDGELKVGPHTIDISRVDQNDPTKGEVTLKEDNGQSHVATYDIGNVQGDIKEGFKGKGDFTINGDRYDDTDFSLKPKERKAQFGDHTVSL